MTTDQAGAGTRALFLGGSVLLLLGAGWFALSHVIMGTATGDAVGESLGVILGLLILVSVVGALRANRQDRR
jgi:hypothetical protein